MQMRTALAAAVAAGVVMLGLSPAGATSSATWTVTPGGAFYTSHQETNFSFLTDTTTGARFQCSDGPFLSGKFQSGNGLANPIGKVTVAHGGFPVGGQLLTFC